MPKNRKKGHLTTVDGKKQEKKTGDNNECQKTGEKKDTKQQLKTKKQEKRTHDNN